MNRSFYLPVKAVMTRDLQCIEGLATIQDALARMKAHHISSLIVERRNDEDEFGLLLVGDIARHVIARNRPAIRTNVYEVMIKPAPAVDADMNIKYAIRHMARLDLSHCIVLHGRELVGLVTLREMTMRFDGSTENMQE